jgi:glycosyltransferase involved in cell wall biosynthesis
MSTILQVDLPVGEGSSPGGGGAPKGIVYIAGKFPLRSETFVYREVRALRERGWRVQAVTLHDSGNTVQDADDLLRDRIIVYGPIAPAIRAMAQEILKHPLRSLQTLLTAAGDALRPGEPTSVVERIKTIVQSAAAIQLAGQLRERNIGHIHCHFANAPTTVGMYTARQLEIPFSFTGHANDLFQRRVLLKKKLQRAGYVACISEWHRDWYRAIWPGTEAREFSEPRIISSDTISGGGGNGVTTDLPGKYTIIRCGVDIDAWRPVDSAARPAMASASANPLFRILTVCRLVEKKGVDTLVRAVVEMKRRGINPLLSIAGSGPQLAELENIVKECNAGNYIQFLGVVDNAAVRRLLAETDAFALCCRADSKGDKDGIPVALMEAMACGVPVVSGDLPAIRELVRDGAGGLLADGDSPLAVADRLEMLARDPALRQRLAEAGRRRVVEEFSLTANVDRIEKQLRMVMSMKLNETFSEKTDGDALGALRGNRVAIAAANRSADANQSTKENQSATGTIDSPDDSSASNQQHSPQPPTDGRRYCLITPCRDEAKYARRTLDSVTRQTITPALWIIVDDGSKDETPAILAEYAAKFPFIKIVRREDRGFRKLGGGVIDAFYHGYDQIDPASFDYVCKLDLDLDLPTGYFEGLMKRMESNPRIGTASGKPYFIDEKSGQTVSEKCGDENSVGMVKFYRTSCFQQIGGFVRELMWDGIDCHRCRLLGWIAVSWDDAELNFIHLRPMGTSHKNWWTGRVRHGVGQYFMGTGPAYMLASAVYRLGHPPVVVGSVANLWGYIKSFAQRKPRYGDAEFRRFLSRYQWACLLKGKSRATEEVNARQAGRWQPDEMAASKV